MLTHSMRWGFMLLFFSLSTFPLSSHGMTAEEKKIIVRLHNEFRAKAAASNMLRMRWDPDLEKLATDYVNKCTWGHNPKRGFLGENLFVSSTKIPFQTALDEWHKEIQNFNFGDIACTVGKKCQHYLQMVWATTDKVACSMKLCSKVENIPLPGEANLIVCNYNPKYRNVHAPFIKGKVCSKCKAPGPYEPDPYTLPPEGPFYPGPFNPGPFTPPAIQRRKKYQCQNNLCSLSTDVIDKDEKQFGSANSVMKLKLWLLILTCWVAM